MATNGPYPEGKKAPIDVVELMSVLQEIIQQSQKEAKSDKPMTKK